MKAYKTVKMNVVLMDNNDIVTTSLVVDFNGQNVVDRAPGRRSIWD